MHLQTHLNCANSMHHFQFCAIHKLGKNVQYFSKLDCNMTLVCV